MRIRALAPLCLFFLVLGVAQAAAQSNQIVDRLLDEKQAAFGDAAYLVLAAAKLIPEEATTEEAVAAVAERKLLPGRDPAAPITLGEVCYLIMETQGLGGGLFYSLFPGPRYAARELSSLRLIRGNAHPSRTLSGEEVMRLLESALERKGDQ
jgi:hypothetical protein